MIDRIQAPAADLLALDLALAGLECDGPPEIVAIVDTCSCGAIAITPSETPQAFAAEGRRAWRGKHAACGGGL